MELIELEDHFTDIGGQFLSSAFTMQQALPNIRAYLFDWDGVFNDGQKTSTGGSSFSEVDSAALRMLRYAHFLRYQIIPHLGVITGAENPDAVKFMESHLADAVYQKSIRKDAALDHFLEKFQLNGDQICYMYDDVLDLAVARRVGLRFCVGRLANPLFMGLVAGSNLADYITASQGNEHAVREVSELLMGLMGNYTAVVEEFISGQSNYQQFKAALSQTQMLKFEYQEGNFKSF